MNHSGFYIFQNKSRYPSVGGSQSYLNRKYPDFKDSSSSTARHDVVFQHTQQEQQIIQQLLQRIQDLERKSIGIQTDTVLELATPPSEFVMESSAPVAAPAPVVAPPAPARVVEERQILFANDNNILDFEFTFGEAFFIKHTKPDKRFDRYIVSRNRLVPFKNNLENPNLFGTPVMISSSHELHINRLNISFTGHHGNFNIVLYAYNTATERVTVLWNLVKEATRNHVYFNEDQDYAENTDDDVNKKTLPTGTYHFYIGLTTKEPITGILNVSIDFFLVKDRLRDIKRHFRNIRF